MKNNFKIIIVVLFLIIIGVFIYYYKTKPAPIPTNEGVTAVTQDSIKGCYVAHLAKDVYTLTILSQNGESVEGKLDIKNFEKDSSTGTLTGTYKNGILLADYTFNSEGTTSVMQVSFKKSGNGFVRGWGDMNQDGTRFADINKITYDSPYVFEASKTDCALEATNPSVSENVSGNNIGFIKKVSSDGMLTIDYVQWVNCTADQNCMDDYKIVNPDSQLRTFKISDYAFIEILSAPNYTKPVNISRKEFIDKEIAHNTERLVWITLKDGIIEKISEQYRP